MTETMKGTGDRLHTLDQRRAALAFDHVSAVKDAGKNERDDYARYAHKLPILIRQAGLAQALAFAHAKAKKGGGQRLLDDLGEAIAALGLTRTGSRDGLLAASRSESLARYQRLTRECVAMLTWYKRFSQSVLDFDEAKADDSHA